MKLLISKEDEITIRFVLAENKKSQLIADTTVDNLKETFGDDIKEGTIFEGEAVFRRPSFADTVEIAGSLNTADGMNVQFNPLSMRFKRMSRLLKRWNLVDGDKPIPATSESIASLDTFVANIIGAQLDAAVGV